MRNFFIKKIEEYSKNNKEAFIELKDANIIDKLTYSQIIEEAKKISEVFNNNGMKNSVAIVFLPATIKLSIYILACFYSNITPIFKTISSSLDKERFDYQFKELIKAVKKVDFVITDIDRLDLRDLCIENKINFYSYNDSSLNRFEYEVEKRNKIADLIIMTSGTTNSCKAVKINFNNLEYSLKRHKEVWNVNEESISLSWAPHSHVLGLITGFLLPMYTGSKCLLMNPKDFTKNPLSLLEIASKYKVTNLSTTLFGLQACINLYDSKELDRIDLSSIKCISVTGEIVKNEVVNKFLKIYSKYNLQGNCICPSYGMTENTGLVCSTTIDNGFLDLQLNLSEMKKGRIVEDNSSESIGRISVGNIDSKSYIYIIDKQDNILEENCLGEIIVSSPGLSKGYINESDNHDFFEFKCIEDGKIRTFFRTGDEGGFYKNQLIITGRTKDIINIKGKKYSPYDIENIIIHDLPYEINSVVAFSVEVNDKELVIVFQELSENLLDDKKIIFEETKKIIRKKMNLDIHDIIFFNQNEIPRTESKKIQRKQCKELYLNNYYDKKNKEQEKLLMYI